MKYLKLLGGLACCLVFTSGAYAQEDVLRPGTTGGGSSSSSSSHSSSSSRTPISIGVDLGMNYNMFSQNVDMAPTNFLNKPFESGSGFSPFFDAYVDIGLSKMFGLQIKLSYDTKNYGNDMSDTDTLTGFYYFDDGSTPIAGAEITTTKREFTVKSAYLGITPLLRINATDKLFFTIGPSIQFGLGKIKYTEDYTTEAPEGFNTLFYDADGNGVPDDINNNGNLTDDWFRSLNGSQESDPQSPRIAIEAGAGYLIPLAPKISLVPKLGFQYFLTPVLKKEDSEYIGTDGETHDAKPTVHSLQLSIGVLFGL